MTGHGQFQTAAERSTVNRHHNWLPAILNPEQHGQHSRASLSLAGRHLFKFLDIRAGDEGAASPNEHRRFDAFISVDLFDRSEDPLRYARAQSVDRRIVNGDDGYFVVLSELNQIAHANGLSRIESYACFADTAPASITMRAMRSR